MSDLPQYCLPPPKKKRKKKKMSFFPSELIDSPSNRRAIDSAPRPEARDFSALLRKATTTGKVFLNLGAEERIRIGSDATRLAERNVVPLKHGGNRTGEDAVDQQCVRDVSTKNKKDRKGLIGTKMA